MAKLKAVVILTLVLGLLVAAVAPAYAGKPAPGGEKSKGTPASEKSKGVPPGQTKPKNNQGSNVKPKNNQGAETKPKKNENKKPAPPVLGPTAEPNPDDTTGQMVTICHKPGTPAQQTLQVAQPALAAHLAHGDSEGACGDELPPPIPAPTGTLTVTVTLCHKPGTPAEKTLNLPQAAVRGHLGHGDYLGPCSEVPPAPIPVPTGTLTVTICHKPGTPAEQTLMIDLPALPAHLNHGDSVGPCEGGLPPPIPVPTGTLTVTLCHQPGTPAQQTLDVDADDVAGHLNHGDTLGPCEELAPAGWQIGLAGAPGWGRPAALAWAGPRQVVLY